MRNSAAGHREHDSGERADHDSSAGDSPDSAAAGISTTGFSHPTSTGTGTAEIDALIAHELAHVRRHDYLVNILQSLLETLLFYHPAVWIVSREVREAREQCCDDLATGVCDPVVYVSALADLAEMNRAPRMALAATGGSLLGRVQRLLGQPHERSGPGVASLGVLTLALVLGGVLPFAIGSAASTDALDGDAGRDVRLHAADEVTEPLDRDAPDHPLLERVQQTPPQPDPAVAAPGDLAVGANVQRTVLNCVVHPDGTVSDCEVVRSLASTSGVDEKLVARPADARAVPAASMQASQPPVQTRDPRQQEIVLLLDLLDSSTDTVFRERLLLTWARGQLQLGGEWTNRRVPPPNLIAERAVAGSLVRHAEAGSVDGIAAALASGADVNTRTTTTPLLAAVSGGHVDAVALLLARGADPNRSVAGIGSPLQRAAAAGDTAMVERLLDHGAMVDQIADQGTALIQASARGHLQVVQLLVERGANVDVRVWADPPSDERRGEWRTAVSAARRAGHEDTASYLVSRGAVE